MVLRAGQEEPRSRRPHRQLRLRRHALRRGLQPLLARAHRGLRRRPRLLPGALVARHLRARLPRRAADARRSSTTSARRSTARASRPIRTRGSCRTSGSSRRCRWAWARSRRSTRRASCTTCTTAGIANTEGRKVWAFMGDGEMDEPESLGAISLGAARGARQPDLRHQLQPAAPRRPGARQRQDHPGAGGGFPRRRLERHQGDLGRLLGSAARPRQGRPPAQAHGRGRRRRVPEVQEPRRRLRARELLRQVPRAARDGGQRCPTRTSGA